MGFRDTERSKEPSSLRVVHESRNGSLPSISGSVVNFMFSSMLLRCSVNSLTKYSWIFTKVSSTYLSHTYGGVWGCANDLGFKLLHVQVGYDRGHWRTHGRSMFLFIDVSFVREVHGVQAERQQFNYAFVGEGGEFV